MMLFCALIITWTENNSMIEYLLDRQKTYLIVIHLANQHPSPNKYFIEREFCYHKSLSGKFLEYSKNGFVLILLRHKYIPNTNTSKLKKFISYSYII